MHANGGREYMNVNELQKKIDNFEICELPETEQEISNRYKNVYTAAVNDVLREMGYLYQTLPNNILPLKEGMKVSGFAFTIKGTPNLTIENEMPERAKMLEQIKPGSICVFDTSNDTVSAQWGEIMTMAARRVGCCGAVVDGGVRDTDKVLEQEFPVFCKYRSSNGMLGRFRIINWEIPVKIGDVTIFPGDFVFGDIDGVIIVPRKVCYEVLVKAEEIRKNETEIKQMVLDGLTPTQIVENGGYF